MRRVYLLLSFIAFLDINCLAQRSADLQLLSVYIGFSNDSKHVLTAHESIVFSGNGNTPYWFTWRIKNLGPDELMPGDTLAIKTGFDTTVYYVFPAGKNLKKDSTISIVPVDNNTGLQVPIVIKPFPYISQSATDTTYTWCDSVYAAAPNTSAPVADPSVSDNVICDTVRLTYWLTGIKGTGDKEDRLVIYPNPGTGRANIKYQLTEAISYASLNIYDIMGKVVYNRSFNNMQTGLFQHCIDLLQTGTYTIVLDLEGKKIVDRLQIK